MLCDLSPCPGVEHMFYSVSLCENRSIATISSERPAELERGSSTIIKCRLPELTLCIHNRNLIELLRVTIRNLEAATEFSDTKIRAEAIVQSLQVDDMNEFATNPVVFVSQSNEQPFLRLIC